MNAKAMQLARDELRGALQGLVGAAERAVAERRARPHLWALFHRRMAQTARPVWRPWHRWRARRFSALAWATDLVGECSGEALAQRLDLPR